MNERIHIKFFSLLLSILICLFTTEIQAQAESEPGVFLCSIKPSASIHQLLARWEQQTPWHCQSLEKVSDLMQVWMLRTDCPSTDMSIALDWLNDQPELLVVQHNLLTQYRGPADGLEPNDPLFFQQWHLSNPENPDAALMLPEAWLFGTGGLSPLGDTLVVAIIDAGIQDNHPDLAANMWRNNDEIPGDLIDNDYNGYVDDFRGWNVWTHDDNISNGALNHGTQVTGVMGAKGNNGKGISGVLWDVKNMFVSGSGSVAGALASFDYVLKMRRLYQESKGERGAFIVALNCSWGINNGQAAQAPLWCAALDSLGQAGILTIAATANLPVDIDQAGDLPGVCPSPYLITVTSLNQINQKAVDASWGTEHVDLGAYGVGVLTTQSGSSYGLGYGTSFAAPQVSGAIALLYSAECHELALKARAQPAAAAARARNLLFESTVETPALEGITKSGKRLDINRLMQLYATQCQKCPSPYALDAADLNDQIVLTWKHVGAIQKFDVRWRQSGASAWQDTSLGEKSLTLTTLAVCSAYEFQVRGYCDELTPGEWSEPLWFTTEGCCDAPDGLALAASSAQTLHYTWNQGSALSKFWVEVYQGLIQIYANTHTDNMLLLENLDACTVYKLLLFERCADGTLSEPAIRYAQTSGCGACYDAVYCQSKSASAAQEWIERVSLGSWQHNSGDAGNGYQLFTADSITPPSLIKGMATPIHITPGFLGQAKFQHFRVYIDWNQDGDFEDATELAFDPGFAYNQACKGEIIAPQTALTGLTRMRISMKMKGNFTQAPEPCEYFQYGQVEDYCLRVGDNLVDAPAMETEAPALRLWPIPAIDVLHVEVPDADDILFKIKDLSGRLILAGNLGASMQIDLSGLAKGAYLLEIHTAGKASTGLFIRQ